MVLGGILFLVGYLVVKPWGWLVVVIGLLMIIFGRDLSAGVKGSVIEHLRGKKYRDSKGKV
jgi:hypothetical protein